MNTPSSIPFMYLLCHSHLNYSVCKDTPYKYRVTCGFDDYMTADWRVRAQYCR